MTDAVSSNHSFTTVKQLDLTRKLSSIKDQGQTVRVTKPHALDSAAAVCFAQLHDVRVKTLAYYGRQSILKPKRNLTEPFL